MKNKIKSPRRTSAKLFLRNWLYIFKYMGSIGLAYGLLTYLSSLISVYIVIATTTFLITTLLALDYNKFVRKRGA